MNKTTGTICAMCSSTAFPITSHIRLQWVWNAILQYNALYISRYQQIEDLSLVSQRYRPLSLGRVSSEHLGKAVCTMPHLRSLMMINVASDDALFTSMSSSAPSSKVNIKGIYRITLLPSGKVMNGWCNIWYVHRVMCTNVKSNGSCMAELWAIMQSDIQ